MCVLNVKSLVGTFNQEKALVGAFSVIVKTDSETNGSYAALFSTYHNINVIIENLSFVSLLL